MKAMILAAGMGTRLQPLTLDRPKALVPFLGVPLLERVITRLTAAGADSIVVNVHHFAPQVMAFLEEKKYFGGRVVVSDESDRLMDTGGGLLKAQALLEDDRPFILHNVDVHTGLDINRLYSYHAEHGALITIAVTGRHTSRSLLFDEQGYLAGWQHNQSGERRIVREYAGELQRLANSCVYVINREFFTLNRLSGIVSLTDQYLELAREHKITCFNHQGDYWYNLGDYESFRRTEQELMKNVGRESEERLLG